MRRQRNATWYGVINRNYMITPKECVFWNLDWAQPEQNEHAGSHRHSVDSIRNFENTASPCKNIIKAPAQHTSVQSLQTGRAVLTIIACRVSSRPLAHTPGHARVNERR